MVHNTSKALDARKVVYANYQQLKGWTRPFTYDAEQAATYKNELGTDDLSGTTLFEIGFGSGSLLAWAQDHGAAVAGSEINADFLVAAQERQVDILPADLSVAVREHRGRFDLIVALDVFEHLDLDEIRRSLEFCADLLKPGGRLLLRFPNAQSPFGLLHQYGDITHKTPLSGDHMRQLVLGLPLEVVLVRPAHRPRGTTLARKIVRSVRYVLQDAVQAFVRFVYVYTAPLAPVVTVELRRRMQ